jgi:hypothetical protein
MEANTLKRLRTMYPNVCNLGEYWVCGEIVGKHKGGLLGRPRRDLYRFSILDSKASLIGSLLDTYGIDSAMEKETPRYLEIGNYTILALPTSDKKKDSGVAEYYLLLINGESCIELGSINYSKREDIFLFNDILLMVPVCGVIRVFDLVREIEVTEEDGDNYEFVGAGRIVGILKDTDDGHIEYEAVLDSSCYDKVEGKYYRKEIGVKRENESEVDDQCSIVIVDRYSIELNGCTGDCVGGGFVIRHLWSKRSSGVNKDRKSLEVLWDGWRNKVNSDESMKRFNTERSFIKSGWIC